MKPTNVAAPIHLLGKRVIIGLVGHAKSGKDTVGMLLDQLVPDGAMTFAFATPMKRIVDSLFNATDAQLYGPSAMRELPLEGFTRPDGSPLTTRYALQRLGDFGRACDPLMWVKDTFTEMNARDYSVPAGKLFVITDVRFINEAKAVKDAGGILWRIHRPKTDPKPHRWWQFWRKRLHVSERDIFAKEMTKLVDVELCNDSTLPALRDAVKVALNNWRNR